VRVQERLFDGVGDDLRALVLVRTVAAPKVTHLKLARRWRVAERSVRRLPFDVEVLAADPTPV